MRLFPTPSKNVLRRIIVTTSLLCYTNHFHRMRFAGFADGKPQSTGTTDSGSGFCAIGFKFPAVEFEFLGQRIQPLHRRLRQYLGDGRHVVT